MDLTGLGSVADLAKGVMDKFWPPAADPNEKLKAQLALQQVVEERENKLIEAQRSIIVAEMNQGDSYTKRARPTIVYAGLLFIFMVHVLFPIMTYFSKQTLPEISLPTEFWWAWTGVCGIWIVGRSAEKKGVENKIVSMITGK